MAAWSGCRSYLWCLLLSCSRADVCSRRSEFLGRLDTRNGLSRCTTRAFPATSAGVTEECISIRQDLLGG